MLTESPLRLFVNLLIFLLHYFSLSKAFRFIWDPLEVASPTPSSPNKWLIKCNLTASYFWYSQLYSCSNLDSELVGPHWLRKLALINVLIQASPEILDAARNWNSGSGDTTHPTGACTNELFHNGAKGHHAAGGAVFQMRCKTEFWQLTVIKYPMALFTGVHVLTHMSWLYSTCIIAFCLPKFPMQLQ